MKRQESPVPDALAGRSPSELEAMFGRGLAPVPPPDGRRRGALLALTAPAAGAAGRYLAAFWQPWRGKRFDAAAHSGTNLLDRSSFELVRLAAMGRYFHWWPEDQELYQAFPFRAGVGPGALDPAQDVLRISYDQPENHPLLRRIVDELVEVEAGLLLGQALVRVGGRHSRAAWFGLW